MTGIAFAAQIFLPNLWAAKVYNEPDEITEMSWNGTIRKKYTDAKHPSEIHYYLVIVGKKGEKKIVDLAKSYHKPIIILVNKCDKIVSKKKCEREKNFNRFFKCGINKL